jgi:hypothetical protein
VWGVNWGLFFVWWGVPILFWLFGLFLAVSKLFPVFPFFYLLILSFFNHINHIWVLFVVYLGLPLVVCQKKLFLGVPTLNQKQALTRNKVYTKGVDRAFPAVSKYSNALMPASSPNRQGVHNRTNT